MRHDGVFVCGTDTGVGKTRVAAGLVRALALAGRRVVGLKPVVAGAVPADVAARLAPDVHGPVWEDLLALEQAGGEALPIEQRAVCRLKLAAAPRFAAEVEGRPIRLEALVAGVRGAGAARQAYAVVEGVGGFRVPLGAGTDTADLALALGYPLLLVVGLRLGCINHALLSAEAIRRRGLVLAAWVANAGVDPAYRQVEETIAAIEEGLGLGCGARLQALASAADPAAFADGETYRAALEAQTAAVAATLGGVLAVLEQR